MEEPLRLGVFVLLLMPGFIFVQTREYHLLRERRSQFEKTFDIVLWSAAIWIVACALPVWWPFSSARAYALVEGTAVFQYSVPGSNSDWLTLLTRDSAVFFGSVCLWAAVVANVWGAGRKTRYIDATIRWWTGRDWYPSVALKFFDQNLSRVVVIGTPQSRYLGTLFSAPDTREDSYIVLSNVSLLPPIGVEGAIEQLPLVRWVLIKFDDIIEMQALTEEASEPNA